MNRNKRLFFFILIFFILFIEFSYTQSSVLHHFGRCKLGSGKDLDGNIVVISIFADDINTTWGSERINPYSTTTTAYMKIATDWITENTKKYGVCPNFIYDYFKYGGLYYKAKFNVALTDWTKNDAAVWEYITTKIDLKWIKKRYNTDNMIFMVYLNTDKSNEIAPATRSYYDGIPYPYEIVYINRYRKGWETAPATYAHEMLHAFGAKDLYYADVRNGFSDEFVEYCKRHHKNDIMLTISDVKQGGIHLDKITNELTDLDAYYLGLKNNCKEMKDFSLPLSEHF